MNRTLPAAFAAVAFAAAGVSAGANLLDNRPYTTLPECPAVRQYVGIVNDYAKKHFTTLGDAAGLSDRLAALGNAYHECARGYEVTRITDSEKADAAQHHIAAESALVYTDAMVRIIVILDNLPKPRWKRYEASFVDTAHFAMVDAKYVLDRSDDEVDKQHAKRVVTAVTRAARRYAPKRYDEIVELTPDDVRAH